MNIVNISVATIPPRVRNGALFKFIDSLLNQTYTINKIYINISKKYNRFENLNNDEIENIKKYNKKIVVSLCDLDSPLIKYIGSIDKIDDESFLFVGDDDQEYHKELIKNIVDNMYGDNYIYQNRYHTVKKGTAGIIHGFVGLLFKKKLLNNIINYDIPKTLWIDDQFMSYYFFNENYKIVPSFINDFDDIYYKLGETGMEQLGVGGDLCLDKVTGKRREQIEKLEKKYNILFYKKYHKNDSKGDIKRVNSDFYNIKINIHYVNLDNIYNDNIKSNINNFIKLYENNIDKLNLYSKEIINKYINDDEYYKDYILYYEDFIGKKICHELKNKGLNIYFNKYYKIDNNFDLFTIIYDYLYNNINFKKNNRLCYYINLI